MPGLDERLTKDLARLSPAVEPAHDVMRRLDDRRRKRHALRVAGTACLAIVVVAGSIGGFAALRRAFREGPQPAITPAPAPGPDTSASLDGSWTVTSYADGTGGLVEPVVGATPTITFFAEQGRYRLTTGCISLEGGFIARGIAIEFVDANRIHAWGCSPELESQGQALVNSLMASTRFGVLGLRGLTLSDRYEDALATFTRFEPPEGRDIGLETPLCDLQRLGGVDMIGDGSKGTAWTGVYAKEDGSCPTGNLPEYVVAVDIEGDGRADTWTPITCRGGCDPWPVGAVDVNVDGRDEIFVTLNVSSTPQYQILTFVKSSEPSERDALVPATVGAVGHPEAGFQPGHVAMFMTGGDEGFAGRLHCQDWPNDTVLSYVWTWSPVDSSSPTQELHRTRFTLGFDGVLALVERVDQAIPIDQQVPAFLTTSRCGDLDLDPFS